MADSVKIRIDGDASGYKKSLENIGKYTKAGLADVKAGIDMTTAAVQKLASVTSKGINYNAIIEQMQTSFEVMTGSAEKAAEVVERLRLMGAETPFEMTDLAGTTQLLMQYGFTADDAIAKMRMLGDIAQGNAQAMTSIATGYAQMSSAGKVNLQDIKQMINAGFNPLQEISERTGESMASLYDRISKGTMQVEEITKSMQMATSEGGKFFQSMEKQSQTLSGQLSTLKDNTDQLLGSLTEGFSAGLRNQLLPMANNMIGELQEAFSTNGTQGLVDAATNMIPRLLDMMTSGFEDGIAAVGKWLPKGAKALMKSIPNALRSTGDVIPQITTVLFEVASTVLNGLTAMLPELVPTVVKGFGDTLVAALDGMEKLSVGFINGVEQMFHQGQQKIAGVWVDNEQVAKYDFKIDVNANSDAAEENIAAAYKGIYEALNTDFLTKDQRDEIVDMIDADYQTIYDKLISFSVPPEDAEVLAANITASSDAILKYLDDLNLGVDSKTLYKWIIQADDSRIFLREILKSQGLSESDIAEVVAVFDTMNGRLKDSTPNIAEQIYAELTDGLADDPEALKKKVTEYIEAQDNAIDEAYNEAVSKLDPADSDYATKLATLTTEYESAKADLQTIGNDLNTLVDTLANASTATVQSKYQLLADVENQVNGLSKRIDELAGEAMTLGQQAYNVVRSGANADEATISQAVNFKISEFKLDEQAAEDAYAEARDELNRKLNSTDPDEKISVDEYNTLIAEAESKKNAAIQAAKEDMERAISEIFVGIAESEGIQNRSAEIAEKLGFAETLMAVKNSISDSGLVGEQLNSEMTEMLAEYMQIDPSLIPFMPSASIKGALEDWAGLLYTDATSSIESLDNSKLATSYAALLESGLLEGTSFNTSETSEQLEKLLVGIYEDAMPTSDAITADTNLGDEIIGEVADAVEASEKDIENASEGISESAMKLIEAATGNMSDPEGAEAAGNETTRGLDIALAKAVRAARMRGEEAGVAFAGGYKRTMMIRSPSKVMQNLGEYTGEGLNLGLQDSMSKAVATAKRLSGQIITAADMSSTMRVNVPNLSQEIAFANEQNKTPVYLDGKQIAEIQGINNSTQIAWQNTKAAKGVGSR